MTGVSVSVSEPTARRLVDLFVNAGVERVRHDGAGYRPFDDPELDSFAKISLYMEVECEFGVKLSPDELLDERCRTLAGLATIIDERCTGTSVRDA